MQKQQVFQIIIENMKIYAEQFLRQFLRQCLNMYQSLRVNEISLRLMTFSKIFFLCSIKIEWLKNGKYGTPCISDRSWNSRRTYLGLRLKRPLRRPRHCQALLDLSAILVPSRQQFPPVTDRGTRTRKNVWPPLVGLLFASARKKKAGGRSVDRSLRLSGAFNFTHDLHAALSTDQQRFVAIFLTLDEQRV